jgi:signal transduction histidine kinase
MALPESLRQKIIWVRQQIWQQQRFAQATEYRVWQQQFLVNRLQIYVWIALLYYITFAVFRLGELALSPQVDATQQKLAEAVGMPHLLEDVQQLSLIIDLVQGPLLLLWLFVQKTIWAKRHPVILFLGLSWSITLLPEIIGSFIGIMTPSSWDLVFLGQAVMIPVRWPLHLLSQIGAVAYYLGITLLPGQVNALPLPENYHLELALATVWTCLICNLAVHLYERLQQKEFASRRELRLFLHAVTHDLRTPVIGTSIVLQKLLGKARAADNQAMITADKLEQLLAGSDRQLRLIDSILEAHTGQADSLHCQPLQLGTLVASVLADLADLLAQNQIVLINRISDHLPLVQADAAQIWRVLNNLITNVLKHNPSQTHLILNADLYGSHMLRCTVQDTGIGIPYPQQQRLFELYYRTVQARYSPGLGLGLYLCKEIIVAHGGQIGVTSQPGLGSAFWFTLPVAQTNPDRSATTAA